MNPPLSNKVNSQDMYVVGLRMSELRSELCKHFHVLKDSKLFDSVLTALSAGFSYEHLWEDVICFTGIFLDDNSLNTINNLNEGSNTNE